MFFISIVSHGHKKMVENLIKDLVKIPQVSKINLILNVHENLNIKDRKMNVIVNLRPRGFSVNHNLSFQFCDEPYFCVLNPDIRISSNPFPQLLHVLKNKNVGVCAPKILSAEGFEEDSHRLFPTIFNLLAKGLFRSSGRISLGQEKKSESDSWLAGMFLCFRSKVFHQVGGFDERYYLYYEDVDLCDRIIRLGYKVKSVHSVSVIHNARRQSRRDLHYALWHLQSMARYLWKRWVRNF